MTSQKMLVLFFFLATIFPEFGPLFRRSSHPEPVFVKDAQEPSLGSLKGLQIRALFLFSTCLPLLFLS
jgi:hypothetical protein